MPFGFSQQHERIHKAISNASQKNVIMLALASNEDTMNEKRVAYPARDLRVICINASDGCGHILPSNPPAEEEGNNFSIIGHNFLSTWPKQTKADGTSKGEELGLPGVWKYGSGSSVATLVATCIAGLIMQFAFTESIKHSRRLQSYDGITQIFRRMSGERTADGFLDIRPWEVLKAGDREGTRFIFNMCLDNIYD
jgi:hypothetical protein